MSHYYVRRYINGICALFNNRDVFYNTNLAVMRVSPFPHHTYGLPSVWLPRSYVH